MHATKNDLPESTRSRIVELLNARLADAIDLQTQCKQAHWNVRGPSFFQLHELFDRVNASVEDYVDTIAERLVQLGGTAEGTVRAVAKRTSLGEYPMKIVGGREHADALSSALAAFGRSARQGIDMAAEMKDQDTSDLFLQMSRAVDRWLWMVEAHLDNGR